MNKLCCLIVLIFTCGVCEAQNLLPNGAFEQYSGCPDSVCQIDSALFWFSPTTGMGANNYLPSYYNQCSASWVGVPGNVFGTQPVIVEMLTVAFIYGNH